MDKSLPHLDRESPKSGRCLLKEIIHQYGIPVFIGLDNELAFVAEVVQLMAKRLKIT
jgi:hypothetical protein